MTRKLQSLRMDVLRRSARTAARSIIDKKNIAFLTIGQKRIGGKRTDKKSLVVYVTKKEDVSPSDRVPRYIEARHNDDDLPKTIPTDVVEIYDKPRTFGFRARCGNILICQTGKQGVCGYSFSKAEIGYLLTNAHVGCDIAHGGAPGLIISVIDPHTNQLIRVGQVIWSSGLDPSRIATDDSAVVRADFISVEPSMIVNMAQPITREARIVESPEARYWYSINGTQFICGHPEPIVRAVPIDVEGTEIRYQNFWVMQMSQGAIGPGHSGSLLCRDDRAGPIACGLVFGGAAPNRVFAFSFKPIFDRIYNLLP